MSNENHVHAQIVMSEGVELVSNNSLPKIVGPTLVLGMPLMETALTFNVSVLTYGLDYSVEHKVKLEVLEDEKVIARLENGISSISKFLGGFVFNFGIRNAVFKKTGVHQLSFYLDDELIVNQEFWTVFIGHTE